MSLAVPHSVNIAPQSLHSLQAAPQSLAVRIDLEARAVRLTDEDGHPPALVPV